VPKAALLLAQKAAVRRPGTERSFGLPACSCSLDSQRLQATLAGYEYPKRMSRKAAVVIGILRAAPHGIIFVERAAHLRDHPGQIGLPGGSTHPQDGDLEATALRELHEEVGVEPSRATVVARLPTIRQRVNDFEVTPFVAVIEAGDLTIDADETAGVFLVPLATVINEGLRQESVDYRGTRLPSLVLDFEHRRIWGLTARILQSFLEHWHTGGLRACVSAYLWPEESSRGNP
jgi:8-oxo-dGTP pyrophosphatase MutT (NUDIX family)